MKTKAAEKT